MVAINTNRAASTILNNLDRQDTALNKTLRNLSTGLRINQSADDVGIFGRVKRLEGFVRSSTEALNNFSLAANYLDTSTSNLREIKGLVGQIGELVTKASQTDRLDERKVYQQQIGSLRDEINRISNTPIGGIDVFAPLPGSAQTSTTSSTTNPLPVDIAFIFDGGGSIAGFINTVKNAFDAFVNELVNRNIDATFSISASGQRVGFDAQVTVDNGDATVRILDSTLDPVAAKAAIAAFPSIPSTSQDTFSSLVETAADPFVGAKESDQITRRIVNGVPVPLFQILVTDHEPEQQVGAITGFAPTVGPGYSPAREAAVAAFLDAVPGSVVTNVLALPGEFDHYDAITTTTGGRLIDANLGLAALTAQLFQIADDIQNLPGITFFTTQTVTNANEVFVDDDALKVQVGIQEGDILELPKAQINSSLLGLDAINVEPSNADFDGFSQIVEKATEDTEGVINRFEGKRNIVQQRGETIFVNQQNSAEAQSDLAAINVSQEADNLVKGQITSHVGSAALSLVNIEPNAILKALEDLNELDGPLIPAKDEKGLLKPDEKSALLQKEELNSLFNEKTSALVDPQGKDISVFANQQDKDESSFLDHDPLALLRDREDTGIFFFNR